jgi:S-adenosylmethionine hydrolase
MAPPIIAFLTDFGTRDHYAAAMKGVALGICSEATLVDITHDIAPQDVTAGAIELAACYRYFPAGTVFVAVVDPGVGSGRRGLAFENGPYRFVGPDNGLLSVVFEDSAAPRAVSLSEPRFALPVVSRTFEGRDRFAPAAAWLARGIDLGMLGVPIDSWQTLAVPQPSLGESGIDGEVIRIDTFGNLMTNVDRASFERFAGADRPVVTIGKTTIGPVVATYADAAAAALCALFGSSDRLEIAMNGGNAAAHLGVSRGAAVYIRRPTP